MKFGVLMLALSALAALPGCYRPGDMVTLQETSGEYDARIARNVNETFRQAPEDWAMIWLMNKPIRLSEQSVPSH